MECYFLVPLHRDSDLADGAPHLSYCWEWLDREILTRYQARTIAPGVYEGIYSDPDTGKPVQDQSRKFIVAMPRSRVDELRRLLVQVCVEFEQKCIYLCVAGKVEFVERQQ